MPITIKQLKEILTIYDENKSHARRFFRNHHSMRNLKKFILSLEKNAQTDDDIISNRQLFDLYQNILLEDKKINHHLSVSKKLSGVFQQVSHKIDEIFGYKFFMIATELKKLNLFNYANFLLLIKMEKTKLNVIYKQLITNKMNVYEFPTILQISLDESATEKITFLDTYKITNSHKMSAASDLLFKENPVKNNVRMVLLDELSDDTTNENADEISLTFGR